MVAARSQPEPQRLLFVFLNAELPKDASEEEARQFREGKGGNLRAVMCVDKDVADLTSFTDLVTESKEMGQEWCIVLIAGLSGKNGKPPTAEDAEKPLKTMINAVQSGKDLSAYMALDLEGNPVRFG